MTQEEYIDDLNYISEIVKQNKELIKENVKLQQENKQLKNKIYKAIEKVKDISFKFTTDKCWYCVVLSTTEDGRELLEILGDKENE